jgi:hypothetical protein
MLLVIWLLENVQIEVADSSPMPGLQIGSLPNE